MGAQGRHRHRGPEHGRPGVDGGGDGGGGAVARQDSVVVLLQILLSTSGKFYDSTEPVDLAGVGDSRVMLYRDILDKYIECLDIPTLIYPERIQVSDCILIYAISDIQHHIL